MAHLGLQILVLPSPYGLVSGSLICGNGLRVLLLPVNFHKEYLHLSSEMLLASQVS